MEELTFELSLRVESAKRKVQREKKKKVESAKRKKCNLEWESNGSKRTEV